MAARLTTYVVVGIVAATLIAGLIAGAQRDDSDGPVDLIVHNGRIYTADADQTTAAAVAIRGNQILRVGSEREIARLRRPQTTMIDARGAAVLPGFNDTHLRLIDGGLTLDGIDLSDASTPDDVVRRVRFWAEANPARSWIVGRGWTPEMFPDGLPTRQLLDAAVGDRPAQLVSGDGQLSWVNSRALRMADIDRQTPNPKGGSIVRSGRSGEPTGVLKQSAMALVSRLLPRPTTEERTRALRAAVAEAHRYGITSVHDAGVDPAELEIYAEARRAGELNVRVYSAIAWGRALSDEDLQHLGAIKNRFPDDPLYKTGAVGISVVPEVRTGALTELSSASDDLNRMVRLLDAAGWQVMTHAAGPQAVRMALNAYEHARRSNDAPARGRRHRIERAELADPAELEKFGALGLVASMQPFQRNPERDHLNAWSRRLGGRGSQSWWSRSSPTSSGRVIFGSGWPERPLNPFLGLRTAVMRAAEAETGEGAWQGAQLTALYAAIDAYTSTAAWASFDEQRKGTIAPGLLADLVVLSADIFDQPPSALAGTTVAFTIFDGKIVYPRARRDLTD